MKKPLTINQTKVINLLENKKIGMWSSEIGTATGLSKKQLGGVLSGLIRGNLVINKLRRWNKETQSMEALLELP